jgi:N-acetylmuramoyl-L-alanine amidase CwlA
VANNSAWSFTDASLNNAVKLAKIIMNKYNIPLDRVVRHYDITGKLCPGIIGWNNEAIYVDGKATKDKSDSTAWEAFKNKLK